MRASLAAVIAALVALSCKTSEGEGEPAERGPAAAPASTIDRTVAAIQAKLKASEAAHDVQCWSTTRYRDELLIDFSIDSVANHAKGDALQQLVSKVWLHAQDLNPGKAELTETDLQAAHDTFSRLLLKRDANKTVVELPSRGLPPIEIAEADVTDHMWSSEGWRILFAVASTGELGGFAVDISEDGLEYLNWLSHIHSLAILKYAAILSRREGLTDVTPEMVERAADWMIGDHKLDGWSKDGDHIARSFAQTIAYSRSKVEGLQSVNGAASEQEQAENLATLAEMPLATGVAARFHDVLEGLAEQVWTAGQEQMSTGQAMVRGEQMLTAVNATLPYEVTELGHVIFFPHSNDPMEYRENALDAFRDDGMHWRIVVSLLEHKGKRSESTRGEPGLFPLDIYAAEELTEVVSNYGVPLLRKAAELARDKGRDEIQTEDLDAAHAWFLAHDKGVPIDHVERRGARPANRSETPVFTDVTAASGIVPFKEPSHIGTSENVGPELMSFDAYRGVSSADFDADGWTDIFIAHEAGEARLMKNKQDGTFTDVLDEAGLAGLGAITSGHFADYDGDGCKDIFIVRLYEPSKLFRSDCKGAFEDATTAAGVERAGVPSTGAIWFDANNDGWLDIYQLVSGDFRAGFLPVRGRKSAQPNILWLNQKDGTFTDATAAAGLGDTGMTLAAVAFDADNDGDQDVYTVNDMQGNSLYLNDGKGAFVDYARAYGVADWGNGMGAGIADVNDDGFNDIFLTNIAAVNPRSRYVRPYDGKQIRAQQRYIDTTRGRSAHHMFLLAGERYQDAARGFFDAAHIGWGWNGFFFDYDNDGWLDLFVPNGFRPESINHHFEKNALLHRVPERFDDVTVGSGVDFPSNSRGAAPLDYDHDGDLDLVVTGLHSPVLLRNDSPAANWLQLDLRGKGPRSDALGARIVLTAGGRTQTRQKGTETGGFVSTANDAIHFGLGDATVVDKVTIEWPGGTKQVLKRVKANRILSVRQR